MSHSLALQHSVCWWKCPDLPLRDNFACHVAMHTYHQKPSQWSESEGGAENALVLPADSRSRLTLDVEDHADSWEVRRSRLPLLRCNRLQTRGRFISCGSMTA